MLLPLVLLLVLHVQRGICAEEDLKTDPTKGQLKDVESPTGNDDLPLHQDQKNTSNTNGVETNGIIPDAPNLMEVDSKQKDIPALKKNEIEGSVTETVPDVPITVENEVTCDD